MFLDEIIAAQKLGLARGIPSICSAHPWVLREALRMSPGEGTCLVEPTCNQVNQFGGYTGMTPAAFVSFLRGLADEIRIPRANVVLGGDHLGPSVWQSEAAGPAMQKAATLVRDYVQAGFVKIHLDCSMRLGDDPPGALDPEASASRTAQLAKVAEESCAQDLSRPRYVIGTEVPIPGGAQDETGLRATRVPDVRHTLELTREAFGREGLESAWERVVAVVVQPGVEFGDDFVIPYDSVKAFELSHFIESRTQVYEAHSTDYQMRAALADLVRDHFAILKVGPALTSAFREAVFALAKMEGELYPPDSRSNLMPVLDEVMRQSPEYWQRYYRGSDEEQAVKRMYSLSDRARYYWPHPRVQAALKTLMDNLNSRPLPLSLLSQFVPGQYERIRSNEIAATPAALVSDRVATVLKDYAFACGW
jgi:D-tagatose-1,6-bisphosphate aldolase subunit GatZ/KbaZ